MVLFNVGRCQVVRMFHGDAETGHAAKSLAITNEKLSNDEKLIAFGNSQSNIPIFAALSAPIA